MPNNPAMAKIRGNRCGGAWPRSCSLSLAGRSDAAQQTKSREHMTMMKGICRTALAACIAASAGFASVGAEAQTQGTIKIGVLHSLSGTTAISQTTLKDTIPMMVDDL